jgi:hypothetical protein
MTEATATPPIDDVTTPTPATTPPTPLQTNEAMEGIETTDSFAYETTLQFYDANAAADGTNARTTVGKQVKEWLSHFILRNDKTIIRTKNGKELKLTEYPENEADALIALEYEIFNNNRRNVSVLITLVTTERFSDLKNNIIEYLQRKNMFMSRHLFKTKKTNIAKCGFFIGKHPRDTFRDAFCSYIETNMSKILSDMTEPAKIAYIQEFCNNITEEPREDNEVRIQECKPSWTIDDKIYTTDALALYCPRADMYLIMDLLTTVFPGVPKDEFDDDPVIKFVPFSTPYNPAIPNAEQAYTNLIHEQNQFLKEHVGIPVGGLSYEAMQYSPDQGMALDSTLYYTRLFTALEPTSIVNKSGKWIFCTTRKKSSSALEYIEHQMPLAYAPVPDNLRGNYPMCPTPRRLSRSPIRRDYMINIVNSCSKAIPTAHRNTPNAPRNAWRSGPPPSLRPDPDTSSTGSTKGSLTSTHMITAIDEHREEVNISISQIQTTMHKFQTNTDTRLTNLAKQLESQIQEIQLSTESTRAAIQSSPALSPENLDDLKCSIISELTPIIHSAIASAMPQLIRQHLDATLSSAIRQALEHLNLSPTQPNTIASPPRKIPRQESMMDIQTPEKEPPDISTPMEQECS